MWSAKSKEVSLIAGPEQKSSPLQQQKSVCENSNMEISVDSSQNTLDLDSLPKPVKCLPE